VGLEEERLEYSESHLRAVYRPGAIDSGVRRQGPPKKIKDRLIDQFGGACAYCSRVFGSLVVGPRGKVFALRREWDHRLPYAYLVANPAENWLPACHVCNRLKRDRVLESIVSMQERLKELWQQHGYRNEVQGRERFTDSEKDGY
jgi:hypothetical protein